jgi:sarcosine oxidase, subunit gamma
VASLTRRGPLHGRGPWQRDGLRFAVSNVACFLLLRGRVEAAVAQQVASLLGHALPAAPNVVEQGDQARILMLAPSRWMIFADPPRAATLLRQIADALADGSAAVSDVSDGYAHIRLEGPCAADLLAAGTSIDLHPRAFNIGCVAQTELARTRCLIWRSDETGYDLLVDASTADYVWTWLDSNAELTVAVHHRTATG